MTGRRHLRVAVSRGELPRTVLFFRATARLIVVPSLSGGDPATAGWTPSPTA